MKKLVIVLAAAGFSVVMYADLGSAQNLDAVARTSREKKTKVMQQKSVRVWTNDNMPHRPAGEGPTAAGGMSTTPPASTSETATPTPPESSEPTPPPQDDKKKSKEYWQGRFKAVRQRLTDMEEQQRLAEDELSLLQVQQARELSPDVQRELEPKIRVASANAETKRLESAKIRKDLDELEKEFKSSGAPAEWMKTD